MIQIPLEQVEIMHLEALVRDGVAETERLELKGALNLDSSRDKKELAKDVSGLANTVGGRIIYGISEEERDGQQVAGTITPIQAGDIRERYENVLVNAMSPRPRFNTRSIPIHDGQVFIVEVYPSIGTDLHMVIIDHDNRYYRRLSGRTVPMSEHEVRECYARIASSKSKVEASLAELVQRELTIRSRAELSMLVLPHFADSSLADPRITTNLRQELALGPLQDFDNEAVIHNMKPFSGGLRTIGPERNSPDAADFYFAITRHGVHHLSHRSAIDRQEASPRLDVRWLYRSLCATIAAADLTLERLGYFAPVQIVLRLNLPSESLLYPDPARSYATISSGERLYKEARAFLREYSSRFGPLVREVLDQLYQDAGQTRCPFLDEEGNWRA